MPTVQMGVFSMASSFLEYQIENALQDNHDDRVVRVVRWVNNLAAKQGGNSMMHNYQLLGQRALVVVGVAAVAVQLVSYVIARKSEEQRMENVARRVFEEERQKEQASA